MPLVQVRLECLRLALEIAKPDDDVVAIATMLLSFVVGQVTPDDSAKMQSPEQC